MNLTSRRLLALLAALAAVILGIVVLVAPTSDPTSLLAGAAIAAGVGIAALII